MIHKSAIIDPSVKLASNVKIGPYSVIGPNVEIGEGSEIGSHVIISGRTKIGKQNKIWAFATIGADPQDLKYKGEDTLLEIGDRNVIREYASIHRGTTQGGGVTKIGNDNLIMEYVHIAHDCILGSGIVVSNTCGLAGHVIIGDYVVFGGFAVVQQFCSVGAYSFIAGTTALAKDVMPFVLVSSYHGPAKTFGLNVVGLTRRGFSEEKIQQLKQAYHLITKENLTVKQVIPKLQEMVKDCQEVQLFIDMLQNSKLGVVR